MLRPLLSVPSSFVGPTSTQTNLVRLKILVSERVEVLDRDDWARQLQIEQIKIRCFEVPNPLRMLFFSQSEKCMVPSDGPLLPQTFIETLLNGVCGIRWTMRILSMSECSTIFAVLHPEVSSGQVEGLFVDRFRFAFKRGVWARTT